MISTKQLTATLVALPLGIALAVSMPGHSAEKGADGKKGTNVEKDKRATSPQTRAVEIALLADQLASYGDQKKDAMALIVAAKLMAEAGGQPGKHERTAGTGKSDKGSAVPQPGDNSVSGLIARARQYAGERKDLIALADDVAKAGTRGAVGGPKAATHVVEARAMDVFRVSFRAGEPAAVGIGGDGDTDLDLLVYDENGNLICRADGPSDDEICRWTPRWTGAFRIEVRNLGRVWNRYRILTN